MITIVSDARYIVDYVTAIMISNHVNFVSNSVFIYIITLSVLYFPRKTHYPVDYKFICMYCVQACIVDIYRCYVL